MKKKQLKHNRINFLISLTVVLLIPFYGKAQIDLDASGNVGIGTTSPSGILQLLNTTHTNPNTNYSSFFAGTLTTLFRSNAADNYIFANSYYNSSNTHVRPVSGSASSIWFNQSGAGNIDFYSSPSGPAGSTVTYTKRMTISGTYGYVGIGIAIPAYQLELSINSAGKPTSSTWQVTSDIRTKTNVASYIHGLDLVRQVKLVSYQYNGVAHTPAGENGIGVIAQDFQQIFPNSVKPFSNGDSTQINEPYLGVDFHELFIANVGAVKQLDSIVFSKDSILKTNVDSLTNIISKQDSINTSLQNQLDQLLTSITSCCVLNEGRSMQSPSTTPSQTLINQTNIELNDEQTIVLEQNSPNPFSERTSITYSLPENTIKAQMLFYNAQGKLIQSAEIIQKGKGTLNVYGRDLSSGIYNYTLVVDGIIIESKRMVKQ